MVVLGCFECEREKEKNNMFLSIITPVYNTSEYLSFCIDSCLQQGMKAHDYEIIYIDDGSMDNSGMILDEYASRYSNLIVVHKVNGGVSDARNIALDLAQGEYIWFIDSDDFIEKNVLPDIYELSQKNRPERIQLNMYHMKSDYFTAEEEELYKDKMLVPGKRLICSAIYRSECINKNKTRFHSELKANGDLVFGYELRKSIGDYKNVVEYEPIVYFYRRNSSSISNTVSSKKLNSFICLCAIMHEHALADHDGFAEYTMVRYLYYFFNGVFQLSRAERHKWIQLIREKKIYPIIANSDGCAYYREHYQTMKIKGINKIMFRWIPTPIGYVYVMIRSSISRKMQHIRKKEVKHRSNKA